ncbi:MAG: type I DNA topoisomerase [Acidimicrobiales bacterium]
MKLVIVESPAKAKTIAGYLGRGYVVESSIGHIRDLPQSAAEVPAKIKGEPWARLGVDVDHEFTPYYVVSRDKRSHMTRLKSLLKDASELYLATDEDREGEAIAWHLYDELKPKVPVRRMVFHEITPQAISAAVEAPREIDMDLVEAQEARRILDRLYGYEVSPVLWKKVMSGLSAGRVQSVATRLVVDRERERMAFRTAAYWDLEGSFDAGERHDPRLFPARLSAVDGARVARGSDFTARGEIKVSTGGVVHLDRRRAETLAADLHDTAFEVRSVESKPYTRKPYAPFRTTTLQQEASRKLGFGASRTMSVAQRLYENGFITYMRTDSVTLSGTAVAAAREQARELYGAEYLPDQPRTYTSKVKNAQEAHEAIRPAGDSFRSLDEAQSQLHGDERALYELIWKRTIASQMVDARLTQDRVRLSGTLTNIDGKDGNVAVGLSASGLRIEFAGFRRAYVEGTDDPEAELADQERLLPALVEGARVPVASAEAKAHDTQPPDRYSEATLIKKLEDLGIGRPSTYASVMRTIDRRGYVWKKGKSLVPTFRAFAVVNLLELYFADLVDYQFTAAMEDQLDEIAEGRQDLEPWLRRFYFGDVDAASEFARLGLEHMTHEPHDFDFAAINSLILGEAPDGVMVSVRSGRYGPYLVHGDDRVSIPEATEPDSLSVEHALELLAAPSNDRELGLDAAGDTIYLKAGRYGPYVQVGEMTDPKDKPKTASLLSTMSPETVTLDDAIRLLSLPRVVGQHPEGGEILAQNGRYGPYLTWEKETRSLEDEDQIFSVELDGALALFAQPKQRGRRAAAKPLADLGEDPETKRHVVVRSGRFGLYVTDGETNATLRLGDTPESMTLDRAGELLAERRNAEPSTRVRRATKKAAKLTPKVTKKATKSPKKTTKKAAGAKKATRAAGATKRAAVAKGAAANAALLRPRSENS